MTMVNKKFVVKLIHCSVYEIHTHNQGRVTRFLASYHMSCKLQESSYI